ncbi:MAG: NERD domain-containing protein kinase family protein, partial [Shewanella sp.]
LADELPDDYSLLTNVEIPSRSGQPLEVDALVIGEWGVYVVDVKGYIGRLNAGMHAWSLDGRDVDNSLAKANYVARVLAGKLKYKIPVGVYAPWCQGMVFVTGRKGEEIELEKDDGALSIYTPRQSVEALTQEWGLTAPRKHMITEEQKAMVLDTIGQVAIVEQRNHRIQDFIKLKCLFIQHGLEIWQAEYSPGGWTAPWLLKILTPVEFTEPEQAHAHELTMRDEFARLQSLSGCSGVPYCAPLIQDGEQLVLPIRMPRGVPMNIVEYDRLTTYQLLEILRRSVTGLQQIHRRGFTVGGWAENCVFISAIGDVEYIDIRDNIDSSQDIMAYAKCFLRVAERTHQPRVTAWYRLAARGGTVDIDGLRCDLSALMQQGVCDSLDVAFTIASAAILDNHYELQGFIAKTATSELWQGRHIQGQYPVGISFYRETECHWPSLCSQFVSLSHLYHPSIEKLLAFGQLPKSDDLYIVRAWEDGVSLDELESYEPEQLKIWFVQLLGALQYLHQLDIYHGAICPKNIIVRGGRAILVNFGIGLDIAASHYASQYADPALWLEEGPAEKDLYGLVASMIASISRHGEEASAKSLLAALVQIQPMFAKSTLYQACEQVLTFRLHVTPGQDYLANFGL